MSVGGGVSELMETQMVIVDHNNMDQSELIPSILNRDLI